MRWPSAWRDISPCPGNSWSSGLLKLFLFLAAASARAVTVRARAARENEERRRRRIANERSALLSLPEDVLGGLFARLDTRSRAALLCTACSVRQIPQVLEQLAPTMMLRGLAQNPVGDLRQLLPSHYHRVTLRRLALAGGLLKGEVIPQQLYSNSGRFDTDVSRLVRFLKQLQPETHIWHELQGLEELQVKFVWEAHDEWMGKRCWMLPCQLPKLSTLRLQYAFSPTFIRTLAETKTGQQLRMLVLDLSYPRTLDGSFVLSPKECPLFRLPGPLAEYVPLLTQLQSLQVLHIRCHPIMLTRVSLAQLSELKSLEHLTLCIPPLYTSNDENRELLGLVEARQFQLRPLKLNLLELKTLEMFVFDFYFQAPRAPLWWLLQPCPLSALSATLQTFVCDSLRLVDLAALFGLPALHVIQIGSLRIECTTEQEAARMDTCIRSSPRHGQVQLILGSCSPDNQCTESARIACGDDAPFTLQPVRTNSRPLSMLHLALSSLIGTPSFTRVTSLYLKHYDIDEIEELDSLADLFPCLEHLSLISPRSRVHMLSASHYLVWHMAVIRLPRLKLLESDHFCLLPPCHGHEQMVKEFKRMKEAFMATCQATCIRAAAEQKHFTLVLGHMCPSFAREIENCWGQHFGQPSYGFGVEHHGISCELVLFKDMCLGVRARLVFQCQPLGLQGLQGLLEAMK